MSEEEIIKNTKAILEHYQKIKNIKDPIERDIESSCYIEEMPFNELQGLLDLYNKEKEKYLQLFEEYNKRVNTIINYEQGLKEIIDAEDDPDTWAYHAVQKLLKEVGGIDYE